MSEPVQNTPVIAQPNRRRQPKARLVKNTIDEVDKPVLADFMNRIKSRKGYTLVLNKLLKKYKDHFTVITNILNQVLALEQNFTRRKTPSEVSDYIKAFMEKKEAHERLKKPTVFIREKKAFKDAMQSYTLTPHLEKTVDLNIFNESTKGKIATVLRRVLPKLQGLKFNISYHCNFEHSVSKNKSDAWMDCNKKLILTNATDISALVDQALQSIKDRIEKYEKNGSGFIYKSTDKVQMHIFKYKPIRGGTYLELPEVVSNKKACININNSKKYEEECFRLCCECHYQLQKDPFIKNADRVSYYPPENNHYDYSNVSFPVQITRQDIERFEKLNKINVNVYHYNTKDSQTEPNLISHQEFEDTINLLVLSRDEKQHFVYIKNMSRLLGTDVKNGHNAKHICYHCLYCTDKPEMLKKHKDMGICKDNPAKAEMPTEGLNYTKFRNYHNKLDMPFYMVADMESLLEKMNETIDKSTSSWTEKIQKHTTCMASIKLVCTVDPNLSQPLQLFVGKPEDVITNLLHYMDSTATKCVSINKPLIMTEADDLAFKKANICHLCGSFIDPSKDAHPLIGENKVRDHCHITGKFRGASHNYCNQQAKRPPKIPVYFHNGKNYDQHFLIPFMNRLTTKKIDAIPNNEEKYMSISFNNVQIKDSFQLMSTSLESLVNNLSACGKDFSMFHQMRKEFKHHTELLCRKGIMCYSYIDSLDRLKETQLPAKVHFKDDMSGKECSEEDYAFAQKVWQTMGCQTLGDYYALYLKTDVLLLADIIESFRTMCLKNYGLDCLHYLTLPSFSWDAMLKATMVNIELLTDQNMYMFFEGGIRGGISVAINKLAYANNPYMNENWDPKKSTSYLMDLDANNLYGWAMCQKLPLREFNWVECESMPVEQWTDFIVNLSDDAEYGYTFEVDVDYPEHLHDDHNDYPFLAESMLIQPEMLSQTQKDIYCKQNTTEKMQLGDVKKLVPNLMHKRNYIVHYRALKQAIQHGLVLKKVHRAVKYYQEAWLKPYILKNMDLRKQSKDDFEKDLFKLANNAIFGKTMENVRNRIDFEVVIDDERFIKIVSDPRFHGKGRRFAEDVVGLHRVKALIHLNKPVFCGQAILDLSKVHMYWFHYDVMKAKYKTNLKLMATDTDSLKYLIYTDDLYKDMREMKEHFDFSDYPKNHPCYDPTNKKIIGKFKDELNGVPMTRFVALRSKVYAQDNEEECKKRCKGIKKNVVKNHLSFEDYERAVLQDVVEYREMTTFRSYQHQVYTQTLKKVALCSFDDKRYLLPNRVDCRALGHYLNSK